MIVLLETKPFGVTVAGQKRMPQVSPVISEIAEIAEPAGPGEKQ